MGTEAAAMLAMAEASYERGIKEQEVASRMPPQELELKRLELIVEGMRHFGQAAWRHPGEMQDFMQQLKPFLRVGPMKANELENIVEGQMKSPQLQLPGTP